MSNPFQFLGGLVGAGIGLLVGGPGGAAWGFQIGLGVASAINPGPAIKGPRLNDMPTTVAERGAPVYQVFGTETVMGTIIWEGPRSEHVKTKKKGGFLGIGGQKIKTYSYTKSCAVGLCSYISDVTTILRIWENGELVYDLRPQQDGESLDDFLTRTLASTRYDEGMTVYSGADDQDVDPTMEAIEGVGNVHAYRGLMYAVFDERLLRDDQGSTFPGQWEFEIGVIAPTIHTPTPSGTLATETTATVAARTTQYYGDVYVVLGTGSELTGITAPQIIAGSKADDSAAAFAGNAAVAAIDISVDFTGLAADTTYTYAIVQQNASGISNILTGSFTTAAPSDPADYDPVVTFGGPGGGGPGTFTWYKPTSPPLTGLTVIVIAGGAGGLPGLIETYPSGSYPSRGGGGGGGRSVKVFSSGEIAALASSASIVVGAGGAASSAGGTSSFGSDVVATGGSPSTTGGTNGAGGVQVTPAPSGSDNTGGVGSVTSTGGSSVDAAGGGGRGGAIASAGAGFVAKDGGSGSSTAAAGGAAGTYPNGAGGNGSDCPTISAPTAATHVTGGGGGGGGAHSGAPGGAGGFPGGGGGAGGNVHTSGSPGAGGAGADGIVVILQTF